VIVFIFQHLNDNKSTFSASWRFICKQLECPLSFQRKLRSFDRARLNSCLPVCRYQSDGL